jgi:hypothetical protein
MVQNWKNFASSDKTTLSHVGNVDGKAFLGVLIGKFYERRPRRTSVTSHNQVIKTNQQSNKILRVEKYIVITI